MDNVIVLNQNVKLASLSALKDVVKPGSDTMILSTQFVFENEVELIDSILECKCVYKNFSDILDDAELESCDKDAFVATWQDYDLAEFYEYIQNLKNTRLIDKFLSQYSFYNKIIPQARVEAQSYRSSYDEIPSVKYIATYVGRQQQM